MVWVKINSNLNFYQIKPLESFCDLYVNIFHFGALAEMKTVSTVIMGLAHSELQYSAHVQPGQ